MKKQREQNNWGQFLTLRYPLTAYNGDNSFPASAYTTMPPSFNLWPGKRDNALTNPTTEPLKKLTTEMRSLLTPEVSSRSSFDKIMSLAHLRVHRVEARPAQFPWQFVICLSLLHHKVPRVILKQPKFSQFWLNSYNIVQKVYWSQAIKWVTQHPACIKVLA